MLCSPFSKTKLSFSSLNLLIGASLKDIFCQSLKIFEKCGKKARISKKFHLVFKVQKRLTKYVLVKSINEILVACY